MRYNWIVTAAFSAVFLSGCKDDAGIKVIDVKLPKHEYRTATHQQMQRSSDHDMMIAYIIPTSSRQWFVKAAIHKRELAQVQPVLDLLEKTLVIDENSVDVVRCDVPKGWQHQKAQGFLHSTITHPYLRSKITFSSAGGSLLSNVNRWNGQLENPEIKREQLHTVASEKIINSRYAIYVKLEKGGGKNRYPVGNESRPVKDFVEAFEYILPAGWFAKEPSGMRKVNIKTGALEVTAISLYAGSQRLAPNVNRWARQVGLEVMSEETIKKMVKTVNLSTEKGQFVELKGTGRSILVTMVTKNQRMWFFKAIGPSAEIEKNREKYLQFIASINFR